MIAWTRQVPEAITRCELTHLEREPINLARARVEHGLYEAALASCGVDIRHLPPRDDLPDSVFVEDTAVVLDEVAVLTRPGAASRRDEVPSVRDALAAHRALRSIEGPGTLDGGDVLVLERDIVVGLTPRTNLTGIRQLREHLAPFGYTVTPVPVRGCLHLKSAATRAGPRLVVVNPSWVDPAAFPGWETVPVDPREPFAANVLWLGGSMIVAESFARTNGMLSRVTESRLVPVPASELAKAEGGVTCCSIVLRDS